MTISANRMATWHQNHSRPMLLTNGTGGTGASTGLGRGHFAIGIFRAPSHFNSEIPAIMNDLSLRKTRLQQKFQQWLFQHVHTVLAQLLFRQFRQENAPGAGALPLSCGSFAVLHELWFKLIHHHHEFLQNLPRLGVIGLLGADISLCQLLTEGHNEERRIRRWCVTAGSQALRKKQLFRDDRNKLYQTCIPYSYTLRPSTIIFAQDSGKPKLRTKDSDFIDKLRSFKAKWRHLIYYSIYVNPWQAT